MTSLALPHPITAALADLIAARFRVIGEPMRIRILDLLRTSERSVQELADALETTQQNASKHLGVLHGAGIVSRRRDGNRVIYAIGDETVYALCETVCGGIQRQLDELDALFAGGAPRPGARA